MAKKIYTILIAAALFMANGCLAADFYKIEKGCGVTIKDGDWNLACKIWQRGSQTVVEGIDVGTCICANTCVRVPQNHYYYDDPVAKHKQADEKNITLPVVLAWDGAEGWNIRDGEYLWNWSTVPDGKGKEAVTSEIFGIKSYVLEIDNTNQVLNDTKSAGAIFRQVLTTTEFNPTDKFYPCFFHSDTTIKWRVRPCCEKDGSGCLPEDQAPWWEFTTSSAPEPKFPKDPDWNGSGDKKDISYKDLKLEWCRAKVSKEKQAYNKDQAYSLSYQIRVYSNENKILELKTRNIPDNFSDLAKFLLKDAPTWPDQRACSYLMKQLAGACKGDTVSPIQALVPRTWWSTAILPNNDRRLFTKKPTYYWQLRRCFDNSNAGDESCASNNEKSWGQIWEFTTKDEAIDAPKLLSPENDSNYAVAENAKLTELPGRISWMVPNGANSFGYDIQEINGASAISLVDNERRTTASQIFFTDNQSDTNGQGEAQKLSLKIDTAYKWRVRSCWPSIPIGDVCEPVWSPWFYFRSTGRAPKLASMSPINSSQDLQMPVVLNWEAVPNAKSYNLYVDGKKIATTTNRYTLDYPAVKQQQNYKWKVQTCADAGGNLCGNPSQELLFKTFVLGAPKKAIYPKNGAIIDNTQLVYQFAWESAVGAHYYKFVLNYAERSDKETNSGCVVGKKIESTIKENTMAVSRAIEQLYCLGKYSWSVLACFDQVCTDTGSVPQIWSFTLVPGGKEIKVGETVLAVCGLNNDNPNTPWDDREQCGIKHTLLTVEQIINFILFKFSIILLPILGLITGIIFYTSFGGLYLMANVKTWWKFIGAGYALVFFAWTLVGIFLTLFGYTGVWWKI